MSFGAVVVILLAVPIGTAAIHASAYLAAAVRRRRAKVAAGCAIDGAPRGRALLRVVAAETAASLWLAVRVLRPLRTPIGDRDQARLAMFLLAPWWLPTGALAVLADHLARAGALVGVARAPDRPEPTALARLASRAETLRPSRDGGGLAIVAFASASRIVGPLVATLPRRSVRRAVLLGADPTTRRVAGVDTIAIRAAGDPWHAATTSETASPAAIELASIGCCTLLVAPHVADLVWESCTDAA